MTTEKVAVRKTTIHGIENAKIHNLTLQGGVYALMDFTVSIGDREKKEGDFQQITGLRVEMDGTLVQNLIANALANQKVTWVNTQVRLNPDRVPELSGKTVRFGETLFPDLAKRAKTVTVARPPTEAELAAYIARLSPVSKMELAIKAMREDGADTELMEAELEALKSVSQK